MLVSDFHSLKNKWSALGREMGHTWFSRNPSRSARRIVSSYRWVNETQLGDYITCGAASKQLVRLGLEGKMPLTPGLCEDPCGVESRGLRSKQGEANRQPPPQEDPGSGLGVSKQARPV